MRYLDAPWVVQRMALTAAQQALRQLAHDTELREPLRDEAATLFLGLSTFARALACEAGKSGATVARNARVAPDVSH